MTAVLLSAPYMNKLVERFQPVYQHYGIDLIVPDVHERMNEEEILGYAGKFDGAICGDDRYTEHALRACLPRLKVLSKWGTGIDSINKVEAEKRQSSARDSNGIRCSAKHESEVSFMGPSLAIIRPNRSSRHRRTRSERCPDSSKAIRISLTSNGNLPALLREKNLEFDLTI